MTARDIARLRLRHQHLHDSPLTEPAGVVSSLGAVQAQDYLGALWAVGLRTPGSTEALVEQALASGAIIRTWPLRGTLHFVSAADARWMIALAPARVSTAAAYQRKRLELDAPALARARKAAIKALRDGAQLTRDDFYRALDDAGVVTSGGRGLQIVWELAQQAVICFGPRRGKQHTFVLFDDWVPATPARGRDEALAELAVRYFSSRGPATMADFTWWSSLAPADARAAVDMATPQLVSETIDGRVHWLGTSAARATTRRGEASAAPGARRGQERATATAALAHVLPAYDEYTVAYKDRGAALDPSLMQRAKYGIFGPTLIIDGRIVGTWKRTFAKGVARLQVTPFATLKAAEARAARRALECHAAFLGLPADIAIGD